MTSRTVTFMVMLGLVALGTNLFIEREDTRVTAEVRNDPDMYMTRATLSQYNEAGQLRHRMYADRFTHYPLTDATTLARPSVTMYPEDAEAPWDIESHHGRLLAESDYREQVVELWDDVVARQETANGAFIDIRSPSMTVYPERDYAETDQRVTIQETSGTTVAAGMQAYLKTSVFVFHSSPSQRVQTVLAPDAVKGPVN